MQKAYKKAIQLSTIIAIIIIALIFSYTNTNASSGSSWTFQGTSQWAPKTLDNKSLKDGDLIKTPDNPDVYIVKYIGQKKFKRLILNPDIFNSYDHLSWDDIKLVSKPTINKHTTSRFVMEVYPDGKPVNGKVYELRSEAHSDIGVKHHINMTSAQFEEVGLDWSSIYNINHIEAGDGFYKLGDPIIYKKSDPICSTGNDICYTIPIPVSTNQEETKSNTDPKLQNTKWVWQSLLRDGNTITPKNPSDFVIEFGADNSMSSSTDCNIVGGRYFIDKDAINIRIEYLSITERYCENSQDLLYFEIFSQTINSKQPIGYTIENDTLTLTIQHHTNNKIETITFAKQK